MKKIVEEDEEFWTQRQIRERKLLREGKMRGEKWEVYQKKYQPARLRKPNPTYRARKPASKVRSHKKDSFSISSSHSRIEKSSNTEKDNYTSVFKACSIRIRQPKASSQSL